jgi:hypothetical protein
VQYDKHGWRNRNRIKTEQGSIWLTIPVTASPRHLIETPILDVRIANNSRWQHKHWSSIQQAYSHAPYFSRYAPMLELFYTQQRERLADLTMEMTMAIAQELGITGTRFVRSSTLSITGAKTERLISLLRAVGSDHYISGPSAQAYIDEPMLLASGSTVEYMKYDYPEYEQLHAPYDPFVSILDLLFMKGPESPRYIWGG